MQVVRDFAPDFTYSDQSRPISLAEEENTPRRGYIAPVAGAPTKGTGAIGVHFGNALVEVGKRKSLRAPSKKVSWCCRLVLCRQCNLSISPPGLPCSAGSTCAACGNKLKPCPKKARLLDS